MRKTLSIALAAGLVLVGTPALATGDHEDTKTMEWFLPSGGTPDNVTWPQPIFTNQCGGWVQVDVYPYATDEDKARTDALDDDGVLSYGEDHGWVKSWSFEQAPACETEPTEEPSSPPVVVPETPAPTVTPPVTSPPSLTSPSVPSPVESSTPSGAPSTAESPSTSTTPPVTASEELAVTGAKTNLAFLAIGLVGLGVWLKRRSRRV